MPFGAHRKRHQEYENFLDQYEFPKGELYPYKM